MNPIAEANEKAWEEFQRPRPWEPERDVFDAGWEAALLTTFPIVEAAIATWRVIERGSGYASVVGLGGAGINALAAAENWMEIVAPLRAAHA